MMALAAAASAQVANLDSLKQEAVERVGAKRVFTQQMVDQILSFAELGFQEVETSRYLVQVPTAWVAAWGSGKHNIAGTLRIFPGVTEELLGTKAFHVLAGLFKDVDAVLGVHVDSEFATS
jgi:metal-dependent amidase/aminoacylase/carboxypeptidase family protein